jgi:hypothetical protein
MTTLANELAENLGIDDPFTDLLEQWFEKWKDIMVCIFTLIIVLGVMTIVGCCIIPCIRGLVQRLKLPSPKKLPFPIKTTSSF